MAVMFARKEMVKLTPIMLRQIFFVRAKFPAP